MKKVFAKNLNMRWTMTIHKKKSKSKYQTTLKNFAITSAISHLKMKKQIQRKAYVLQKHHTFCFGYG